MNVLLEQFLSEAREALEGIGNKLMQLEIEPANETLMVELFRLVHTLKGNSGLFDFPEMTRVLHAGEDLMDAVRKGHVGYSQALADRLLDAMDFVGMLCDDIEHERPVAPNLAGNAARLARLLRDLIGAEPIAEVPQDASARARQSGAAGLAADLSANQPDTKSLLRVPESVRLAAWRASRAGSTLHWIRYQPSEECFFQGEDPLHQARLTPGLLWGGIAARAAWPALAQLDAYRCMLDFDVLVTASRADIELHFRYVPDQIEILDVAPLALIVPQGDPNGGPIYEDFVADALGFLARADLAGLSRAVRSMLELSSSTLWLSSALRWIALLLETEPVDAPSVQALIESLRTLTPPDWSALADRPESASPAEATTAVAPASSQPENPAEAAWSELLAVQREILSLTDNAPWQPGRIKAVAAALRGCLRSSGRASEETALDAALDASLQAGTSAALADWLEAAFSAPGGSLDPVRGATTSSPSPKLLQAAAKPVPVSASTPAAQK